MRPAEERTLTRKRIALLGSTGSIGRSTLDVLGGWSDRFEVVGLAAAGRQPDRLAEQVRRHRPVLVSVADAGAGKALRERLDGPMPRILIGAEGAEAVAVESGADLVVAGIVGAAGLRPTLAALRAGKAVALANKETLVMAGELMTRVAAETGVEILPVDSEHNAVHQCLRGGRREDLRRIILTASGGPFRTTPADEISAATPEQALRHPTWDMGPKISIDSATLMNKGLEVIEAHWLFGVSGSQIEVVIHPQSVVHSMVEFRDGSILAQLGVTDMRHPIQYALSWPERRDAVLPPLDVAGLGALEFGPPDTGRFPALRLAYAALEAGGRAPATLNAANEVAVDAFLEGRCGFPGIARTVEETLGAVGTGPADTLEAVLEADRAARDHAEALLASSRRASL